MLLWICSHHISIENNIYILPDIKTRVIAYGRFKVMQVGKAWYWLETMQHIWWKLTQLPCQNSAYYTKYYQAHFVSSRAAHRFSCDLRLLALPSTPQYLLVIICQTSDVLLPDNAFLHKKRRVMYLDGWCLNLEHNMYKCDPTINEAIILCLMSPCIIFDQQCQPRWLWSILLKIAKKLVSCVNKTSTT